MKDFLQRWEEFIGPSRDCGMDEKTRAMMHSAFYAGALNFIATCDDAAELGKDAFLTEHAKARDHVVDVVAVKCATLENLN